MRPADPGPKQTIAILCVALSGRHLIFEALFEALQRGAQAVDVTGRNRTLKRSATP